MAALRSDARSRLGEMPRPAADVEHGARSDDEMAGHEREVRCEGRQCQSAMTVFAMPTTALFRLRVRSVSMRRAGAADGADWLSVSMRMRRPARTQTAMAALRISAIRPFRIDTDDLVWVFHLTNRLQRDSQRHGLKQFSRSRTAHVAKAAIRSRQWRAVFLVRRGDSGRVARCPSRQNRRGSESESETTSVVEPPESVRGS
jgi:hypothetical protein